MLTPLTILAAAALQTAPAADQARWVSRWDRGECQLIRAVGDAQRIGLRAVPNADQISLWVFPAPDTRTPRGAPLHAVVAAPPAAATLGSDSVVRTGDRGNWVYKIDLPLSVLNPLAGATSIRVDVDGVRIMDLPLRSSAAAIDVLRQCMRDQSNASPPPHSN